jgi:hypothetical protein
MDVSNKVDIFSRADIAAALKDVSKDLKLAHDPVSAERVFQLSEAVESGKHADLWSTVNIYRVIDSHAIIEGLNKHPANKRVIFRVELARNLLVFTPLLVSWFYISLAMNAYGKLTASGPDLTGETFIYFWQHNFGGNLAGIFSLSMMAGIDAALLLAVLVCTFLVFYLENKREQELEKLRFKLNHALAGAEFCLASHKWQQPTSVADSLRRIVEQFERQATQVMGRVEVVSNLQGQQATIFGNASERLRIFAEAMHKDFTVLATLSGALNRLPVELEKTFGPLQATIGRTEQHTGILAMRADEALQQLNETVVSQKRTLQEQSEAGLTIYQLLAKIEGAVQDNRIMAAGQKQIAQQVQSSLAEIVKQQGEFSQFTGQLQKVQKDIETGAYSMAENIIKVSDELERCLKELNSYTYSMADLVHRVVEKL